MNKNKNDLQKRGHKKLQNKHARMFPINDIINLKRINQASTRKSHVNFEEFEGIENRIAESPYAGFEDQIHDPFEGVL